MTTLSFFPYRLYLVISEADCKGNNFLKVAEQALLGGVDLVQLREKTDTSAIFTHKALQLQEITNKYGVPLIVNDNLEVAIAAEAAGIHVGNNDVSPSEIRKKWKANKCIGYSIEYIEQLENEQTALSDYLGISPVFSTATKSDTVTEWGLEGISRIRQLTRKPLVAIGNVHRHNIRSIFDAGADCAAVVSAICSAANPQKAAYELKNEILR